MKMFKKLLTALAMLGLIGPCFADTPINPLITRAIEVQQYLKNPEQYDFTDVDQKVIKQYLTATEVAKFNIDAQNDFLANYGYVIVTDPTGTLIFKDKAGNRVGKWFPFAFNADLDGEYVLISDSANPNRAVENWQMLPVGWFAEFETNGTIEAGNNAGGTFSPGDIYFFAIHMQVQTSDPVNVNEKIRLKSDQVLGRLFQWSNGTFDYGLAATIYSPLDVNGNQGIWQSTTSNVFVNGVPIQKQIVRYVWIANP